MRTSGSLGTIIYPVVMATRWYDYHDYILFHRSGQQIMLGDKVVVRGERLGCVAYIGKLDFDIFDQIYIGVCLDMPGTCTPCW